MQENLDPDETNAQNLADIEIEQNFQQDHADAPWAASLAAGGIAGAIEAFVTVSGFIPCIFDDTRQLDYSIHTKTVKRQTSEIQDINTCSDNTSEHAIDKPNKIRPNGCNLHNHF
jgi:hypothetical protein